MNKKTKIQKSNQLNNANFTDFSLSNYRVFLNLVSKIQKYRDGDLLTLDAVHRTFSLSASEYAKEFNIEVDNAYSILKEATDRLMKSTFSINITDKHIRKISVCSQADYYKDQGKIDIRFSNEIMPHLAELSNNFTMYNLNEIAGFDSIYSTRFFELISQYKTTGILDIAVKDLRFALGCSDKFAKYNDFKRYTFAHAIEEINAQYNLKIQLTEEIKTGKAVTRLLFTFNKRFTKKTYDPVTKKYRTEISKLKKPDVVLAQDNTSTTFCSSR